MATINWQQLYPGSAYTGQPQRWEALQKRTRSLTRRGLTNFVTAMLAGTWATPAAVARLDEAELIATYEGPLQAGYTGANSQTRLAIDKTVSEFLGGNVFGGSSRIGLPCAGIALSMAVFAADSGLPSTLRP